MVFVKNIFILFLMSLVYCCCISERITYMSLEHPCVSYYNPKFLTYANLTSRRYGRKNPVYYVGLNFSIIVPLGHNIIVDFYFYEWLTNVYKRSFIEFHYTWCSMLENDMLFGSTLRQGKMLGLCPYMPGQYNLVNLTVNPTFIPPGFPFTRGRIYCNISYAKTKERVAEGYIDMRVEKLNRKDVKNMFNL